MSVARTAFTVDIVANAEIEPATRGIFNVLDASWSKDTEILCTEQA
jgi:hypothetical protein